MQNPGASEASRQLNWQVPAVLKAVANLLSYVFHPLFIPLYVTAFVLYVYPYYFSGFDSRAHFRILVTVFINLCFFPALVVFLLWRLKFSKNIFLKTQRDRIIPYAASLIFYFWAWQVFKNQTDIPAIFVQFIFGAFLSICGAWMANIFVKISMHTTALGGMAAFLLFLAFADSGAMGAYLAIAIFIAGLVGTARLLVSDHTYFEIYTGYTVGILCQVAAAWLAN
ncbi:MAG TPA: hypothetical protein VIK74_07130 [Parasegetibacter sp.]|jgi:hypothetical protein